MIQDNSRHPILYKGEFYNKSIRKEFGGPRKEPAISYEQARDTILKDISLTREKISQLPTESKLPHEFVLCLRMDPDFSAKSYYPESLFTESSGLSEVGSRIWRKYDDSKQLIEGKLFFVRATNQSLERFEARLKKQSEKVGFQMDIRKVKTINTLVSQEQMLGIPDNWKEGRLEAVLHPFSLDKEFVFENFLKVLRQSEVKESTIRQKQYDGGITFVSFSGNQETIRLLQEFNPLRTMHPLNSRGLPIMRGTVMPGAPQAPIFTGRSKIIVGMFDGGVQSNNDLIGAYVDNTDVTSGTLLPDGVDHGTAVAGAILYGSLNDYKNTDVLPEPNIFVKSFRVLPTGNPKDFELYEIIDSIESIIPQNKSIKVYNLSLGPEGPILDDHISRFTYACDTLSEKYNVLFCVAVGNDGERITPYNRIQSPADIVNGLGVAAYTKRNGFIERAPYSCFGPGREGNKLKPDLAAFGGCDQTPIHLVSTEAGKKNWNLGTSFATPLVSRLAAQLIGLSRNNAIDALTARAIMIHGATRQDPGHDIGLGHGTIPDDINALTSCNANSYVLIYKGQLAAGKYVQVEIPWVDNLISRGMVNFRWTTTVMALIDPQSPDDYTAGSVVVAFYPNAHKYRFTKGGRSETVDIKESPDRVKELINDNWKRDPFPLSEVSTKKYMQEPDLKADLKWDTVDTRSKKKKVDGVSDPMFHVHGLSRGKKYSNQKIKFAIVLTVELPGSNVDLYSQVINSHSALLPIKLLNQNEVRVQS